MSLIERSNEEIENQLIDVNTELDAISAGVAPGDTGASASVSQSATSVELLAANAERREVIIRNEPQGNQVLYVAFGATATLNEAIALRKGDVLIEDKYTGQITGIWDAAGTGNARITEVDKA